MYCGLSFCFCQYFDCMWSLTWSSLTVSDEHKASLQAILDHSPFRTQEELLAEIEAITSSGRNTGTRIIIWNLRRSVHPLSEAAVVAFVDWGCFIHQGFFLFFFCCCSSSSGPLELDFQTDAYDIRLPHDVYEDTSDKSKTPVGKSHVPDILYSLRVGNCNACVFKFSLSVLWWKGYCLTFPLKNNNKWNANFSLRSYCLFFACRRIAGFFIWSPACRSSSVARMWNLSSWRRVWPIPEKTITLRNILYPDVSIG